MLPDHASARLVPTSRRRSPKPRGSFKSGSASSTKTSEVFVLAELSR